MRNQPLVSGSAVWRGLLQFGARTATRTLARRPGVGALGLSAVTVVAILVVMPNVAWACPVCFSAKNEANQIAYLATTGFLTFLPLGLIGGVILWIRRRAAELDRPLPPDPTVTRLPGRQSESL